MIWNGKEFTVNATHQKFGDMLSFTTKVTNHHIIHDTKKLPVVSGTVAIDRFYTPCLQESLVYEETINDAQPKAILHLPYPTISAGFINNRHKKPLASTQNYH